MLSNKLINIAIEEYLDSVYITITTTGRAYGIKSSSSNYYKLRARIRERL